ncbi:hypothetical protein MRX96_014966 [Rhipicephalus microplus]
MVLNRDACRAAPQIASFKATAGTSPTEAGQTIFGAPETRKLAEEARRRRRNKVTAVSSLGFGEGVDNPSGSLIT